MNKYQQEIEALLNKSESSVNKRLQKLYKELADEITQEIIQLQKEIEETDKFSKKLQEERLTAIRNQMYAKANQLASNQKSSIFDFLHFAGDTAFNELFYEFEMIEKIPVSFSMLTDRQIATIINTPVASRKLSTRLQGNSTKMKQNLNRVLTRGFAKGLSTQKMARQIADIGGAEYRRAMNIARTEGGRVTSVTRQQSQTHAKEIGIKLKKRWVSTLDGETRNNHRELDGQVREIDEYFKVGRHEALQPHMFGIASEDCNCRCRSISELDGYEPELRRDNETSAVGDYQTYGQWLGNRQQKTTSEKQVVDPAALIRDKIAKLDMSKANKDDIISLGRLFNSSYKIGDMLGDKEQLKDVFSLFRDMGGTVPKEVWYKRSSKLIKDQLQEAFDHYPKRWVDYLEENGKRLFAGKTSRGFFLSELVDSTGRRLLTGAKIDEGISIYSSGKRATTAYHEIGHMVEFFNSDLVRLEREFVASRTKGEKATKLADLFPGWNYRANEVTKKDDFISPYIGKDYGDHATEVLSIGLESIFEPGNGHIQSINADGTRVIKKITDDPEYLNFIIGLILKG